MDVRHIGGDSCGARIGSYHDGTKIRLSPSASVKQFGATYDGDTLLTAGLFALTVSKVTRGGPSGLSTRSVTYAVDLQSIVSFWVPITSPTMIIFAWTAVFAGLGVFPVNLTATSGDISEEVLPYIAPPDTPVHVEVYVAA